MIISKYNNITNNIKVEKQLLKETADVYKELLFLYIENKEKFL